LIIVGHICESVDIFVKDIIIQEPNKEDYIVFLSADAYGRSMSSIYNLHPIAAEVMIEDGEAKLIRKQITFEDVLKF